MSYQDGIELDRPRSEELSPAADDWSFSEVDHRIANSFTLLAGTIGNWARVLSRQQRAMSSEEVSRLLAEVGSRVAAVGQLHRDIATQPKGLHFDLNEHLSRLAEALIASLASSRRFELAASATEPCPILTSKVLPVSLIVTEIVTNALKYAHPAAEVRGRITLGCGRQADGSVLVEVADDGVGLPEGFDPLADGGLGSKTVVLLARKLGAEIAYASGPIGLRFTLRLPPSVTG